MRIRTRLFLISLCVLVPALLISALGSLTIHTELRQAHREVPLETARSLGHLVDGEVTSLKKLLETLADSPLIDQDDLIPFHSQAAALARRTGSVIELDDETGANLLSSARHPALNQPPELYGFRLPLPHDTPHALISDLYSSPTAAGPVLAVRIPVMRDGIVRRSLSMVMPVSSLQPLLTSLDLPTGWIATVLDRSNVIVARSVDAQTHVGKHLNQLAGANPTSSSRSSSEGVALSDSEDGSRMAAFSQRSRLTGYRSVITIPAESIDRGADQAAFYSAAVLAVLLSLAGLGAFYLIRGLLVPLAILHSAAEGLAQGAPVLPLSSGVLEFDQVVGVMARASLELRSSKAELERQVSEAAFHSEKARDAQQQKQKLEAMGRLTNAIAHDFNNVLQTMTSALQMAHASAVTARARMLLETCERAVRRAGDLTRQLMAFGQIQEIEPETVDPAARIHAMNRLLRGALPASIDLRYLIADDAWPVTLDATQFELTLLNLTIHVRDAMDQGSTLLISVYNETLFHDIGELHPGDYILVTVDGSGDSASQHTLADAIETSTAAAITGTSADLGLPQAYGFARQCGGTLLLHEGSQGTRFTLYLPRAHASRETDAGALRLEDQQHKSMASLLFVEDDLLVREVVSPALRDAGFDVVDAVDGDTALAMLESGRHFDLVFSDIMMPGQLNGIGLAQHVKRDYPGTRVVLTTGYSQERIMVPGIQVLGKPYAIGEVVTVLNAELADMHPA